MIMAVRKMLIKNYKCGLHYRKQWITEQQFVEEDDNSTNTRHTFWNQEAKELTNPKVLVPVYSKDNSFRYSIWCKFKVQVIMLPCYCSLAGEHYASWRNVSYNTPILINIYYMSA